MTMTSVRAYWTPKVGLMVEWIGEPCRMPLGIVTGYDEQQDTVYFRAWVYTQRWLETVAILSHGRRILLDKPSPEGINRASGCALRDPTIPLRVCGAFA